ncbi:MAG: Trm112 family protein [Thermomicrobiales bacterium]
MAKNKHSRPSGTCSPDGDGGPSNDASALASWLRSLLVCPVDQGRVTVDGRALVCDRCGRRYAVRDGIPVMLPGEAEKEQ